MEMKVMINTGDNLICIFGNDCYTQGIVYTVGDYINPRFFAVMIGDDECWYATAERDDIVIHFDAINDACFKHYTCAVQISSE